MKHLFQILFLAFIMCFVILGVKDCIDSRPIIVFIGGGSAKNYINDSFMKNQKIEKYPGSFYINVPSKIAWLTLVEEIARYEKPHYKNKPTAIICLSADAIDTTFIKENNSVFVQKRIVGIELGTDELIAYQKGSIKEIIDSDNNTISVENLKSIIMNNSVKIYTTKKGSGTLNAYERLINDTDAIKILKDNDSNRFYEFFTNDNFDSNCLILGSKYYKPNVASDSLKQMKIKGKDNKKSKKPICVYFATYLDDRGFYIIDEPIRKFISSFKSKINKDVWKKIENNGNWKDAAEQLKHNKNGRIIYLNDSLLYVRND